MLQKQNSITCAKNSMTHNPGSLIIGSNFIYNKIVLQVLKNHYVVLDCDPIKKKCEILTVYGSFIALHKT